MKTAKGARPSGSPLLLAGLLLAIAPTCHAQWKPYFLTTALANSEPISIQKALHGWKGSDAPGRRQYAAVWAEFGVTNGRWGVGTLRRLDYSLRFTPDAAELYGAIADGRPLSVGKTYDLKVRGHALEAWGLRAFVRNEPLPGLSIEAGLSLLRGTYMIEGSIHGTGRAIAPKQYEYTLGTDYIYTKDFLFERDVPPREGTGASLDASLDWIIQPRWEIKARWMDGPGFVLWKGIPYTQASAFSQRTQTDDQAFQRWDPLVSGTESYRGSYRQSLPPRGSGDLFYLAQDWKAALGTTLAFGDWSPRLGLGKTLEGWDVFMWYWPADRTLGLDVRRGGWSLGLALDNPRPGRAHQARFSFSYQP